MWDTVIYTAVFVVLAMCVIFSAFGVVYRRRAGWANVTTDMKNQTVIITGASAGIGKEAARDLAGRGARVIMACRNLDKASKVAGEIEASTGSRSVVVRELDTSSLDSVRRFASRILAEEHRLDVLVLNAGIGGQGKQIVTSDDLELTMATNHFGHFLLANLLLGLLKESKPSRVVVVSSMMHSQLTTLDVQNLNFKKGGYWAIQAYALSKACNILFANYLAAMMKDCGVVVNSMCPGIVATEIFKKSNHFFWGFMLHLVSPILGKTPEQGAQTMIYLAASQEAAAITGKFFENCQVSDNDTNLVRDPGLAKKVWEVSEQCVGLKPEEQHY